MASTHDPAERHIVRSRSHYSAAEVLRKQGEEWAAVAYFYAAYRAVRAALFKDSRLDSDAAARAIESRLNAGSRHVEHHNGHPRRGPGLNEIVGLMYGAPAGRRYELLHIKSIEVRYADGITAGSLNEIKQLADDVIDDLAARKLI